MITRVARRVDSTLLFSRQSKARLFSASYKINQAAASPLEYNVIIPENASQVTKERLPRLVHFLGRARPLTFLPTPQAGKNAVGDSWFIHPKVLEMVGIIDACLHNFHDVPRAQKMFNRLRQLGQPAALETGMYNAIFEAYIFMAKKNLEDKASWGEEISLIFKEMEDSDWDKTKPNAKTYSILLNMLQDDPHLAPIDAGYLLSQILKFKIPIMDVVCNPYIQDPEQSTEIAKILLVNALKLGFKEVVSELGHVAANHDGEPESIPEVLPVYKLKIKGDTEEYEVPFNLNSLRRQLSLFVSARKSLDSHIDDRQKALEELVVNVAEEQFHFQKQVLQEKKLNVGFLKDNQLQKWLWEWQALLRDRVDQEIKKMLSKSHRSFYVGSYLSLIKAEKLSVIAILQMLLILASGEILTSVKTTRCLAAIGMAVENEYRAELCRKNFIPTPKSGVSRDDYFTLGGYSNLQQRRVAAARYMSESEEWSAPWTLALRTQIAGVLVDGMLEVAQIVRSTFDHRSGKIVEEVQPAFNHGYEYIRGQRVGVITVNPAVSDHLAKDSLARAIRASHLPMLVKPKPWLNYDRGGYVYNKATAMRFKDCHEQEMYLRQAVVNGQVELVFASLDVLGGTGWKINRAMFDLIIKVWNSGERFFKVPPAVYEVPEPVLLPGKEDDLEERSNHTTRLKAWAIAKANNHSERCSVNYRLEIARAFLTETFYYPHSVDFRGRTYPIPAHFNHIGDDLCRGLLLFSEAKPLGVRGLMWLKIHVANLYGYDKASFAERVDWIDNHMDDIRECVREPLEGSRWWLKADSPWEFLAASTDLLAAYELEDPTTYESAFPVHQDGTCNGLQHYAALGGDVQGAHQVNLSATDRPSDVYSYISDRVEISLNEDAKNGNEMAKLLLGKVTRKVVKQTVMTTVYGVTYVGARAQIAKQLKERGDISAELVWKASRYLTTTVLSLIGDTFKGASEIQNWLAMCGRLIAKSIPENRAKLALNAKGEVVIGGLKKQLKREQMTSVIWTSALGLPIVQPYRKISRKQIMTALQSIYISDPQKISEVDGLKQSSAFPPNFIHSLDATHMMLSALESQRRGLTFAAVHDSYWAHACDIDKLSEIIRETFIALHTTDILGRLEEEFKLRYKGYIVPLSEIALPGLMKKLKEHNVRFNARHSESEDLASLEGLIKYTDDKSDISVPADQYKLEPSQEPVYDDEDGAFGNEDEAEEENENAVEVEEEENFIGKRKGLRSKTQEAAAIKKLNGKFIQLANLIPPVPKKGTFNIDNIRSSKYFFS